jgi:membrane fusion protein, multidrug efflux system
LIAITSTPRKFVLRLLFFGCTALLLASCGGNKSEQHAAPPPPDVGVSTVQQQSVPIYGNWVASLDGYVTANIQPQVSGYLIRQNYREGSYVRKGDVLFEIDPRPFKAALEQAQGQLAQARGQLGQAQAQLGLAQLNVKRDTPLAQAHAIAQSQLDTDIQSQRQNEALIQAGQAAIEAAQASVATAQLNLGFTKVRSLVDGIAGIAATQIGNLVSQSSILTTVSQVNPIKVYFSISEQEYMSLADKIKTGVPGTDLLRVKNPVPLQLTLANGTIYQHSGRILFADRSVDPRTGTIRIVGAFANPGNILRPGQFGRITALTSLQQNALVVPQRAVSELQGRYQIAVVGPDNKIGIRTVQVGDKVGELWVIQSGVQPGDHVVSEGSAKVRDGEKVTPQEDKLTAVSPYSQGESK